MGELFGNVLAEGVARSSGGDTPAASDVHYFGNIMCCWEVRLDLEESTHTEVLEKNKYILNVPIVRITPNQIAHGSLVRHLLHPIQIPRVIQGVDARTQSPV